MKLYYWNAAGGNYGDLAGIEIIKKISGRTPKHSDLRAMGDFRWHRRPGLLGLGSIFHQAKDGDVIWGTGVNPWQQESLGRRCRKLDIRAVRGPLSRDYIINKLNLPCPEIYGDPALLLPKLFPEWTIKPCRAYGVIPHYRDLPILQGESNVMSPLMPWRKVVEFILGCELLISSSLHGIIIAEAFGIPARWLRSDRLPSCKTEPEFKFHDYFLSTGRTSGEWEETIEGALRAGGMPPIRHFDSAGFSNSFPHDRFRENFADRIIDDTHDLYLGAVKPFWKARQFLRHRRLESRQRINKHKTDQAPAADRLQVATIYLNPVWTNPYCRLTLTTLEQSGVKVLNICNIRETVKIISSGVELIDLHWPEYQVNSANPLRMLGSILLFHRTLGTLKRRGIKIVWTVHNFRPHKPSLRLLFYVHLWLLARQTDCFIVFTAGQKQELRAYFRLAREPAAAVVPHGHYIGVYPPGLPREACRRNLSIPPDAFVYLCFGVVREYKGLLDLIRSFRKVRRPEDVLLIAGEPSTELLRRQLVQAADSSVVLLLEIIADHEVAGLFGAADVCVFPFKQISNSGSVILALSLGKPVICPRMGTLPEVVTEETGICYDPGGLENALKAIKRKDLSAMGTRAVEKVRAHDWTTAARIRKGIYQQVLER